MMVTAQYPKELNTLNSKSTSFSASSFPVRDISTVNVTNCLINKGIFISSPSLRKSAKVLKSFSIQILLVEEGYVATSPISDIYELGDFIGEAVLRYLYSLVDELIWLQEQKGYLSVPMLNQLDRIQAHLSIS
ncbi:MAG: hypothetical protein NVS4B11_32010 [Ktedonobacteraceae bacterium]